MVHFILREEHLKLLRQANIGWDGVEFGAPAIDCKRPYGNSSVYGDMGEILGIRPADELNREFSQEQMDYMNRLHKETKNALQIILSTGQFRTGLYSADDCKRNWQLEDEG